MIYLIKILCSIVVVSVMGFTKAFTSYKLGDSAIKNMGKVTLNPKKHVDILGIVFFILFSFGWSTPLETSSLYYKNRKKGNILVNVTPIILGLVLAFIIMLLQNVFYGFLLTQKLLIYVSLFMSYLSLYFINYAILNVIPIYPLLGQKVLKELLPINKAIAFYQNEKILQLIFVVLLFTGILTKFLSFISVIIINIFGIVLSFL